ncbi:MAG: acyl-[acyl-carrier-protein]--UDP-N-acetylglucosamine O-acyltransferase [Sulfuricurvum sp. GWF2_44_89]|uniref:Acyl-[acyl-carrier-protein]--UDP-N-acetylglucosamine O-acyltransferase n=1 Tax=Sulfuricurvum kujiense TaxID=148813 RepID=A0A2D3WHT8_9BACT|nr:MULTISPECIES: acyl-ACP--UDP-N-acetylglucosamine O-acyltransferase [Sulfuricurvum]OHD79021.1 MAG: acyl-[acyl-carrier-protein]--UDP-N-acetylglucosamine O-acyltransferase [Sulfuricurvum sp. GWF2_44_89]OHD92636.1 MAG: acyl-[acyl-carrier-protein]--UDP-N-acetylglucosamine O-acyltransferase [Sulfuricurvum sp. RIFOXYD12_FULL_44_77]OHD97243.1 MAG: acyl-[acyl-carrier-protein]--UDP-N-acetylglucosamine O-acyltransferase [Sulfuricurvum sp. RIFOXYD2_FULL_44_160]DAB38307.1 MAG TPA: acyl-[acyl-carrier-prote
MSLISPHAIIEEGAVIGENVEIGPFCFISGKAKIGRGTKIAASACIYGNTTIGEYNEIFSHAVLGSVPQDLKYAGEEVELIIGDRNKIREFTLFNPGTAGGGGKTVVGNDNLFMGYVHLGHDVIIGDHCILANAATLAGHVEMGNYAVIGGMTPVHQFVKIGDYAMIAGASALSQDVPPYCLAEGNRAVLRGLNLNGLRRHVERADIDALRSAYRELFESGKPLQEQAGILLQEATSELVKNLCTFVVNTKRGIPYERNQS